MVSLGKIIGDPFRVYGMEHFCTKYSLKVPENLDRFEKLFSCKLTEKAMQDHVVCWRDSRYGQVPLFEEQPEGKDLISIKGDVTYVNFDIFNAVGRILSGELESFPPESRKTYVHIPFLDIYEKILFDALCKTGKAKKKPMWPGGKKFAVCLTHDVDEVRKTYQYLTRTLRHAKKREFSDAHRQVKSFFSDRKQGNNPYWSFEKLMAIEEDLGVRSTLFFLQEDSDVKITQPGTWRHHGRRYRFDNLDIIKLINRLSSKGWEVGLHGSFNSYDSFKKIIQEKEDLEANMHEKVTGIRQHNLNLVIPDTWMCQENAGLEYDTTLGFNNCPGFRYATSFPFYPFAPEEGWNSSMLEIPMIIEDIAVFREADPRILCKKIIDYVEEVGGVLTLLWHHSVFENPDYPGWGKIYANIIRECKIRGAWVTTAAQINHWWRSKADG